MEMETLSLSLPGATGRGRGLTLHRLSDPERGGGVREVRASEAKDTKQTDHVDDGVVRSGGRSCRTDLHTHKFSSIRWQSDSESV